MDSLIFPLKQLPITSFPSKNICLMNKQIGKQFMFAHLRNSGTDCWGSEGMRRWYSFFFFFFLPVDSLHPFLPRPTPILQLFFRQWLREMVRANLPSRKWNSLCKSKLASYITHSEMTGIELPPPTTSPRVARSSEIEREL